MENTPLYTALREFSAQNPLRMHMPGHKGKPLPIPELAGLSILDFTELSPTGNLYEGGGVIGQAEALWAQVFRLNSCLFLTGGSTQGMLAALTLACSPGSKVLLDRGCHRSAFHALALLDLTPIYVPRPWLSQAAAAGPVSPTAVERLLEIHPDIKALCITSPTYYGVLSDIPALAELMHRRGGILVVDGAHGAHLPFLGLDHFSAADLAVVSTHKTLPAPGQTALLLAGARFSQADLRRAGSIYGSSSPSYPMMAALDVCRVHMLEEGGACYRRTAELTAALRRDFPALTDADAPLDPTRLTLFSPDGFQTQEELEEMGVWPEMADRGHVVLIPTCADGGPEFDRLRKALEQASLGPCPSFPAPPELPRQILTPRQALFSPGKDCPLPQAEGHIAAAPLAPYPPGIPIVAPGEGIEKKTIAYLLEIGYNRICRISCADADSLCVNPRQEG